MKIKTTLISLTEYAKLHNVKHDQVRRALKRGVFKTAVKQGRQWFFNASEPYPNEPHIREYERFTYTDRLTLEKMLRLKTSKENIALAIGKTASAVYREIKRGQCEQLGRDLAPVSRYLADVAEERYRDRVQACGGGLKIGSDRKYAERLEALIYKDKYSPAAAVAQAKKEGHKTEVSVNTVYSYIDKGVFKTLRREHLPCGGKSRRKYGKVKRAKRPPKGTSIEKRPPEVHTRQEFGHWEMDTVHGKADTKATLLVLTERLSRYEVVFKMPNNKTATVVAVLNELKRNHGNLFALIFKTITVDNGSEFADTEGLQRAVAEFVGSATELYYCHPYSSFERGSNENANKLIRRWIPKGTPIENYSSAKITEIQDWMNNYPRKLLNWCSARELFDEQVSVISRYHMRN